MRLTGQEVTITISGIVIKLLLTLTDVVQRNNYFACSQNDQYNIKLNSEMMIGPLYRIPSYKIAIFCVCVLKTQSSEGGDAYMTPSYTVNVHNTA